LHTLLIVLLIFGLPLTLTVTVYLASGKNRNKKSEKKIEEANISGLIEPPSLHPLIDPNQCLGCGSCVRACPEGDILGLINRKAHLVSPANCIGHGACKEACPTDAIALVFGTETRGVEIPNISSTFETSVRGLFIAGELGGMGLIKNAIAQGQQAIDSVARSIDKKMDLSYHVIIIGAGPAGISAALAAKAKGLRYIVLEQDTIGGTVAHYPRGKIVMTQPASLPLIGKFQFREASKEALIEFWSNVVQTQQLSINTDSRVDEIERKDNGFEVATLTQRLQTQTVLLSMGRRGTPRKLGVTGEDLSKVVYRLIEPEQYDGKQVLVVGGGDSALEAACSIAERPGTNVLLSYRNKAFSRAKEKNRDRVKATTMSGKLNVLLASDVVSISENDVQIRTGDLIQSYKNDAVIVCAGGILPTSFLKKIGVHVEEKFGTI